MTIDGVLESRLPIDGEPCAESALPHVWSSASAPGGRTRRCARTGGSSSPRRCRRSVSGTSASTACSTTTCSCTGRATAAASARTRRSPAPVYTFSYVDKVFDFIVDSGVRPSSSSASCRGSWPRRPRRCSGGARTAARPRTWRAGSSWSPRRSSTGSTDTASTRCASGGSRCGTSRTWCRTSGPGPRPSTSSSTSRPCGRSRRSTPSCASAGPRRACSCPTTATKGETEDRSATHATAAATDVDALDWRPVWIEDFIAWCAERELPDRLHLDPPLPHRLRLRRGRRGGADHPVRRRHLRRPDPPARDRGEQPVPRRGDPHHRVVDVAVEPRLHARHAVRGHLHHPGVPEVRHPRRLDLLLDLHRRVRGGRRGHRAVPRRVRPGERERRAQADVPRVRHAGRGSATGCCAPPRTG